MTEILTEKITPSRDSAGSDLLRGAALATAGVAAASLLAGSAAAKPGRAGHYGRSSHGAVQGTPVTLYFTTSPGAGAILIPGSGNTKVLNYALALETLEAELYRQALARLTGGGTDMFNMPITGLGIGTDQVDVQYVSEFGTVELQHRDFLTSALGGNFALAAGVKFDFGINTLDRAGVNALIYAAELTGVSAYTGAVPFFADKTYLAQAAAILGTEARHTAAMAIVQNVLFGTQIETAPLANENNGRDVPLDPDIILYGGPGGGGANVPGGHIGGVSGNAGFVVM